MTLHHSYKFISAFFSQQVSVANTVHIHFKMMPQKRSFILNWFRYVIYY